MDDNAKIMLYSALLLSTLFVLLREVFAKKKNRLSSSLIAVALSIMCWQICSIVYHASSTPAVAFAFYDLNLPFVALTTLATFLFVLRFYSLEKYMPLPVVLALLVVPIFTLVFVLTNQQNDFLREYMYIISFGPRHVMDAPRGIWFWIHTGLSYVYVFLSVAVIFFQHSKLPKNYRMPSRLLMLGIGSSVVCNYFVLAKTFPINIDFSMIGVSFALIALHLATAKNQGMDFLMRARSEAFNSLDAAVFVLDDERGIVEKNLAASKLLLKIGCETDVHSYDAVLQIAEPFAVQNNQIIVETGGVDLLLPALKGEKPEVYNLFEKPIFDNERRQLGMLVICSDVTENRGLIKELEESSGQDALTGLANLRWMEKSKIEVDAQEYLPLTMIMGDLNNLKQVNDTLGHQQGDVLLRVTADILTSVCPPTARLARIGGDEFLILLPNTTENQARAIIADIKHSMKNVEGHRFVPSMAFGFAIKDNIAQNINKLIQTADRRMYADKELEKAAQKAQATMIS